MTQWSSPFIGNDAAVRLLGPAELVGAGAHAYLLTGPEHVGKRTLALRFAAFATCLVPDGDRSCGSCRSCAASARGAHPDIHVIERRDDRRTIVVEQAQEVARISAIKPYQSDRKVVVIVDAEALEARAANLLLKTIEEPSDDTRIVLTSGDGDLVLPTIRSRCREVTLGKVGTRVIIRALEARGVPAEHASVLARLSNGRPGWAINAAADPSVLEVRGVHLDLLSSVLKTRRYARLPLADRLEDPRNLARTREAMASALATWTGWWRDVLVVRAGCEELASCVDRMDELRDAATKLEVAGIAGAIRRTGLATSHLDDNVNPRLALEGLFLDLPELGAA